MATLSPVAIKQGKNFLFNFTVNLLDGGFFGLALGFASFSTVIPLFVSNLTDSAVLIGLIPAIHMVGWQLPQIFMAHRVSQQKRYKPMTMFFTIHERLPFLGLAIIAWFIPQIGPTVALVLTFACLVWQGIGGGLAANPWQNMIGKIIPRDRWGLFFGSQSAAANLFASVGAVIAGVVLQKYVQNIGFTICFLLAVVAFSVSFISLGTTREEESIPLAEGTDRDVFWGEVRSILKKDTNFRWFVVMRMLIQLGIVGFGFYSVYLVREFGVSEATAGVLTAVLLISQTIFSPVLGWLGDHWSHRGILAVCMTMAALSAGIAAWAPSVGWFYPAYALAGISYVGAWSIVLAMVLDYGKEHEKPAYIGLANTLIAPTAFLIPLLAGWLADSVGYQATFLATAIGALATVFIVITVLHDKPKTEAAFA